MSAAAIALNELEWRNAAIAASAGEVVSQVIRQPASAIKHLRVHRKIDVVTEATNVLLTLLHAPQSIAALEAVTLEQRHTLGRQMKEAHQKIHMLIAKTDAFSQGRTWSHLYAPHRAKLAAANRQLEAHANSLCDSDDASLILLTKQDQEFLLEALLNPKEPSEEMRRVFARR